MKTVRMEIDSSSMLLGRIDVDATAEVKLVAQQAHDDMSKLDRMLLDLPVGFVSVLV